jgi:hypothetical protein
MEHRWSVRTSVSRGVVVECPRMGQVQASLRDVSLGGAFIETGSVTLPLDAPIALWFVGSREHCVEAMVVRLTAKGAGLMFLESETELAESLQDLLFDPSAPTYPPAIETRTVY